MNEKKGKRKIIPQQFVSPRDSIGELKCEHLTVQEAVATGIPDTSSVIFYTFVLNTVF